VHYVRFGPKADIAGRAAQAPFEIEKPDAEAALGFTSINWSIAIRKRGASGYDIR